MTFPVAGRCDRCRRVRSLTWRPSRQSPRQCWVCVECQGAWAFDEHWERYLAGRSPYVVLAPREATDEIDFATMQQEFREWAEQMRLAIRRWAQLPPPWPDQASPSIVARSTGASEQP